jgi:hypothetical protein
MRAYCAGEPGQETPVFWTILHRIEEFDRIEAVCAKGKDPTCQRVQYGDQRVDSLFTPPVGRIDRFAGYIVVNP